MEFSKYQYPLHKIHIHGLYHEGVTAIEISYNRNRLDGFCLSKP
jgi:hypothetical protein